MIKTKQRRLLKLWFSDLWEQYKVGIAFLLAFTAIVVLILFGL